MPLKPGDHVDRYAIQDLLGAGGMGEVYRAVDERLQRSVALKILHPGEAGTPDTSATSGAARLLREARAAAALEHPNVVAIYDVGEVEEPEELRGTPYLAMELIRGESLRDRVGEPGVSVAERIRWLVDVAKALGAAHQRGLVHRDVKPENVMIRDDGTVKVLDFGIAKRSHGTASASSTDRRLRSTTGQGVLVGTPYYMSPEQMRGESLDGRSDQFSWGVMAYELLAGVPPWRTDGDALNLVAEVLSHDPEPPSALDPAVPKHVSDVVLRAMAKSRDQRFPSMEHVVRALLAPPEAFDETDPHIRAAEPPLRQVTKKTSTPLTPADAISESRPRPSRRRAWVLGALAAAGLGLFASVFVWREQAKTRPPAVATPSSSAAASSPAPGGGCTSSAACVAANGGKPYRCRKDTGACVALESEDCRVSADEAALKSDRTVWLASMFPMTGPDAAAYGTTNAQAVELARQDFAQTMEGFEAAPANRVRPFGLLSCDDAADPRRAAKHVAEDVGVAAVIGLHSSTEAMDLAPSVFLPRGVLLMVPLASGALVTSIPQSPEQARLVWRTTFNLSHTAAPVAAFVQEIVEPRLGPRARPVRVAFLRVKTPGALALSTELFRVLRFNGKTALENGGDYRELVLDDAAPASDGGASDVVRDLLDFAPDVIVFQGTTSLFTSVIAPLESRWPAGKPRPIYPAMTVLPQEVFDFVGTSAERRKRFFGLTTVSTTEPNAKFVMHYNEAFPDKITRTISPNSSYDAFYVLAYAAYALAPDEPVTGEALARAIPRLLPPGKPIDVGPTSIFDAYTTLSRGGHIDLDGATGHLDLDPATGEAPVDMAVLCVATDDKGRAADSVESGLVYDATAKKLTGTLKCP